MDFFAISAPLVLSCMLRIMLKDGKFGLLTDNLLLVFLVQCVPSFWITLTVAFAVFIGLAFYETRAEYMNPVGNVREISPNYLIEGTSVIPRASHSLPSNANPEIRMCPINLSGTIAANRRSMVAISNTSEQMGELK
jgi:hypothetical protein